MHMPRKIEDIVPTPTQEATMAFSLIRHLLHGSITKPLSIASSSDGLAYVCICTRGHFRNVSHDVGNFTRAALSKSVKSCQFCRTSVSPAECVPWAVRGTTGQRLQCSNSVGDGLQTYTQNGYHS